MKMIVVPHKRFAREVADRIVFTDDGATSRRAARCSTRRSTSTHAALP
jgi:ABC-type polar amino acid transport system ATPase subunit